MAVSVFKTYVAGEVLTASDLNSSFSQIHDNGEDLGFPATKAKDFDGFELILDGDADTSITVDTDDRIDIRIAGTDSILLGHATGNTGAFVHFDQLAHTATAATSYGRVRIGNTNAVTIPAGTTAIAATLFVEEPNITATGTVTDAVTLYIEAAPTEGGTGNYSLLVDAGRVRIDEDVSLGSSATAARGRVDLNSQAYSASANTDHARLRVGSTNALTVPAGTTTRAAGLWVEEPNLTATGTITNAATVYIAGAPTEGGTTNYALHVDAGNAQFDELVAVGSTLELGHATDTTLSRSAAGVLAVEGVVVLDAEGNATLTGGFNATEFDAGTKSSGTYTPSPADGNFQKAVNGGAHTLAVPTTSCSIVVQYTNNASAGTITMSGFTEQTGEALTTTNGSDFLLFITRVNGFSTLHVRALQ